MGCERKYKGDYLAILIKNHNGEAHNTTNEA